jgi:integrase
MSVRKRTWTTSKGEKKESWVADYTDQDGERHIRTFERKKDADEYHATVKVDVRHGVHTAPSKSITVAEAAEDWIAYVELEGRERSTVAQYRQHADQHIKPRIGRERLARLTMPRVNAFRDDLLMHISRALAKKVLTSLKSLLRDAQRRGNVAQNVAADVSIGVDKRGKRKLKVGVDIPTPDEIKRMVHAASGRWRPLLLTAIFTGLRASELRGLRWLDVDFQRAELHVRQRADRYNAIGKLKSEAGERVVPLGPLVLNTLKEWKLACPKSKLGLVFSTGRGNIDRHENIIRRALIPVQIAAGVTVPVLDKQGKPVLDKNGKPAAMAKYTGLHALRHFYASWCINRRADGGLELPAKVVQERLGHASIVMTMDTYGHLFPRSDDGAELAVAERALLA